jgi:2-polyprenyl-6-methoxyphenol hydroxylase-like FAD-dependent oxidoreductase
MAPIYPGRGVTASVQGRHPAHAQQRGGDIVTAIDTALVVGGGTAGTAAAILLARGGVAVDLVESSPDVTALGSGIALHGNGLRVLDALGLLGGCVAEGYAFSTVAIRAPDSVATVLAELESFRTGGPALPAALGMYRPDLARILMSAAQAAGVSTRFATTVGATRQDEHGVEIDFSDGSHGRYDVLIGADGVRSRTRRAMGVSLDTVPVGLGVWRIFASRPAEVTRAELYYGGRCSSAGYTPTSRHSLYAYLYEPVQDRRPLSPAEQLTIVRDLASSYHGPWDAIRESMTDPARIHYAVLESHLLDAPWNRGRIVLIGDAAHTFPPTLAQGAAMALEDAAVLAELLLDEEKLDDELWATFAARRQERVRAIVDWSLQLCRWQLDGERGDVADLTARVTRLVSQPA